MEIFRTWYNAIADAKACYATAASVTKYDLINAARDNDDEALDKQWNQDDPLKTFKKQRLNNNPDGAVII